mmetsp:Transcript_31874/g.62374  ORF Transcript_31874/g.62374 Transcript_31874/m.62374 type:complete len:479 (-) Transcript_31874:314-1750(-)
MYEPESSNVGPAKSIGHTLVEDVEMRGLVGSKNVAHAEPIAAENRRGGRPARKARGMFAPQWKENADAKDGDDGVANMPANKRVIMTYVLTFAQTLICILQLTGTPLHPGSQARWGLGVYEEMFTVPFLVGNGTLIVKKAENPYYGPETRRIVQWGAKYAPCMRSSSQQDLEQSIRDSENNYGCCTAPSNDCGMMNSSTCAGFGGTFTTGRCDPNACNLVLGACCFGVTYNCLVVREEYCDALSGLHHLGPDSQQCSDVNCLNGICGLGANEQPGSYPQQAERFFLPIWLHAGLIHMIMNMIVQLQLGAELEKIAGWWRFLIMYFGSGIGGNIFASVFVPDQVSVGASSAIYGLFGVDFVLLFHVWKVTENKYSSLMCSVISVILYLGIGTLPWIDNWAHFGGFLTGLLLGNIFLPYFKWSGWKRNIGLIISFILLGLGLILMLSLFYANQEPEFCSWCKYVSCIPYSPGLCDSTESS